MKTERAIAAAVLALGLSALLYAQAPGLFSTLNVDGDLILTTPSGAKVSFQSLVDAGVGLPMTIDSDTSTPGYQCPSGMSEIMEARGRVPIAVTPSGTLGGINGDAYTDTDIARRGGTGQPVNGSPSYSGPGLNGSPSYTRPVLNGSPSYTRPTVTHFNPAVAVGSHGHSYNQITGSGTAAIPGAGGTGSFSSTTGSTTPSAAVTGGGAMLQGGSVGRGTLALSGGSVGRGTLTLSGGSVGPGSLSISSRAHPAPGFQMLWCSFS